MTHPVYRWTGRVAVAAIPIGLVVTALAQQGADRQRGNDGVKRCAALIEQGQLDLHSAAEIAEKHVEGTAVEAACDVQASEEAAVIHEIKCVAKDKVVTVRVNGKTKEVVEPRGDRAP